MAKTSKRGVRLTDGGYGKRPKHYVPGETSSNKPNKKKKSKNSKKNIKAKAKKRPPKKTKSQKAVVFDLFVKNENKPLSNIEIAEKTKFITHNIRRITGEETHKGSLVRVDRGIYKLSDALYSNLKKHNNPYTRINNEELPKYIFEEDEISQYTKDLIESITKEDIQKAIFKAKPKYFKDKNKINVSVTEYLNFEFLIQNNYYIEKVRKDKNDVLMYSFSGSLKHYYLRKRTSDKKYLIPLFPLFIYLFKEKTNKELRKEYSLESFEYFLRHLNNELPNQELISSTEVGKSILFKIRRGYMDIFNKSIKDAIEIEKELRIEIWNDLKESTTRKKLTTRDEWNEYISNKYNVNLHRTERGIYRESRRTKKITKDDIGLAF